MLEDATRRERIDGALLRRIHRHADLAAREELVQRFTPLVKSVARKYRGRNEPMDDLIQAGMIGLVKAIDRFDPDAGHRFISFAVPNIQGEIRRHFRDHTWAVHVPRSMQELDAKVQIATRRMEGTTGTEPTDADLAQEVGATVTDIRQARSAGQSYRALSLDAPAGEDRDVLATFGAVDRGYLEVEDRDTIACAMQALGEREKTVVRMRYQEERLQREIADEIGVSQMQVSRILMQAQERMGAHLQPTSDPAPIAA